MMRDVEAKAEAVERALADTLTIVKADAQGFLDIDRADDWCGATVRVGLEAIAKRHNLAVNVEVHDETERHEVASADGSVEVVEGMRTIGIEMYLAGFFGSPNDQDLRPYRAATLRWSGGPGAFVLVEESVQ